MAEYPCDFHLARYSGPSIRLYVNAYREDQALKLKASVCPACFASALAEWANRALVQGPAGAWDPQAEDQELEGLWIDAGERSAPLNGYRRR